MINPLLETIEHTRLPAIPVRRPEIVFEGDATRWPLDDVLRLRAAHPGLRVVTPLTEARSADVARAFLDGAKAYVVGSGDAAADLACLEEVAGGRPPFAPVR